MAEIKTHDIVELVEEDGRTVIQTTTYEIYEIDERKDDGKRITSYVGYYATNKIALVHVVDESVNFDFWATAPAEQERELFHHPSQHVSPGDFAMMWPSKSSVEVDSDDTWQSAA